jgi:hypothetical protein
MVGVVIETTIKEAGLRWEAVASLTVTLQIEMPHYAAYAYAKKVHTRRSCTATSETSRLRHSYSGFLQRERLDPSWSSCSVDLADVDGSLGHLSRCRACAGDDDVLELVALPPGNRGSLMSLVAAGREMAKQTVWLAERELSIADAAEWRSRATVLARVAGSLDGFADGASAAAEQATEALARVDALVASDRSLHRWAARWALRERFVAAPVPASVLAGPLGGLAAVEQQFRRFCTDDPAFTGPPPGFEALYAYWDGLAGEVPSDVVAVAAISQPDVYAAFGRLTHRAAVAALEARFAAPQVRFAVLPLPVVRLVAHLAALAHWECVYTPAPHGVPSEAAVVASRLAEDGFSPAEAVAAVANLS